MSRKNRPPKNRFCRRSKLAEDEFTTLVRYYFHEVLYGDSRNNYCFYFKIWHRMHRKPLRKSDDYSFKRIQLVDNVLFPSQLFIKNPFYKKISDRITGKKEFITRQRIGRLFNKLSQYIWDNYVITQDPSFQKEDFFDGLLNLIYNKEQELSTPYKLPYAALGHIGLSIKQGDIRTSLMFDLLSKRSKVVRGFKKDKFYLEFSRVLFICIVIRQKKIKYKSLDSVKDDLVLVEILTASTAFLLNFLEKNPL